MKKNNNSLKSIILITFLFFNFVCFSSDVALCHEETPLDIVYKSVAACDIESCINLRGNVDTEEYILPELKVSCAKRIKFLSPLLDKDDQAKSLENYILLKYPYLLALKRLSNLESNMANIIKIVSFLHRDVRECAETIVRIDAEYNNTPINLVGTSNFLIREQNRQLIFFDILKKRFDSMQKIVDKWFVLKLPYIVSDQIVTKSSEREREQLKDIIDFAEAGYKKLCDDGILLEPIDNETQRLKFLVARTLAASTRRPSRACL